MDLIDTFRTYHPKTEYTFFSSTHRTISRKDHILAHKINLNKFKIIEVTPCVFSGQNAMKSGVNHTHKNRKDHKYMEVK